MVLYSVVDTVVISVEYVCCSVVFDTLVGVSVFSLIWLLMTSAISCPLWSSVSVQVSESGVCVHIYDEN